MKITLYSGKGGAGKTPIALNMALEHEWAIATNDALSILSIIDGIEEDRVLEIDQQEEFPDIPDDVEIVFDLGGAISESSSPSILSAVKQSDWVLVPIENIPQSIVGGQVTIKEIMPYAKNIMAVATKLKRTKSEPRRVPIEETSAFKNIKNELSEAGLEDIPVMPLRFSEAFLTSQKTGLSIQEMVRGGGIQAYSLKDLAGQLDNIHTQMQQ